MRAERCEHLEAQPETIYRHGDVGGDAQAKEYSQELPESSGGREYGFEQVADCAGGVTCGPGRDERGGDGKGCTKAL